MNMNIEIKPLSGAVAARDLHPLTLFRLDGYTFMATTGNDYMRLCDGGMFTYMSNALVTPLGTLVFTE